MTMNEMTMNDGLAPTPDAPGLAPAPAPAAAAPLPAWEADGFLLLDPAAAPRVARLVLRLAPDGAWRVRVLPPDAGLDGAGEELAGDATATVPRFRAALLRAVEDQDGAARAVADARLASGDDERPHVDRERGDGVGSVGPDRGA